MSVPRVSVIVPSLDGDRGGSVARLRVALKQQSLMEHELILVVAVSPQGKAINQGARQAVGDILVVLDDDSSIEDSRLLQRLVTVLDADPSIGMAGASVQAPPGATRLQQTAARDFPRFNVPVVSEVTDSDLACHGCAAFPAAVFNQVGGENESLVRGLDPDLRNRLRAAGYRVVLAPDAVIYHPLPPTLGKLLSTFYRNGRGSAYAQAYHPELIYDTDESLRRSELVPRRGLLHRGLRMPLRIFWALLTLRPLRALAYGVYGVGFVAWLPRYLLRRIRGGTTAAKP